ncbi:MAG: penicillin-binding protein 1A, partial [Gammaproteobacteria bacterium]
MRFLIRLFVFLIILGVGGVAAGALAVWGAYLYVSPKLPNPEVLKDAQFQVPLRIYSRDGLLMAEYGDQRREPIVYADLPETMVQAFIAAEDDRFFEHPGVDWQGLARAALELAMTGRKKQGGSTITMQVARNFFLSREKTYMRKLNEIFLALKIEQQLSKQEIMALYLNKIYLGQRSYGVGAAAQIYYGTDLDGLALPQIAMIAGLPKAPSTTNPITNPDRAKARRAYVLRRMRDLGFIDADAFKQANEAPISAYLHVAEVELAAPYVAEMARADLFERYGEAAYTDGYRVITRVESNLQLAAQKALRMALLGYDRRHGYRGVFGKYDPEKPEEWKSGPGPAGELRRARVLELDGKKAKLELADGEEIDLDWDAISWARPYIDEFRRGPAPKAAKDVFQVDDIILVENFDEGKWKLAELPQVEGAIASLDPKDGGIIALTGGFDYYRSKFNRAAQAMRQGGSNLKPFIYTSAFAKGLTPATLINDAPVVFEDAYLESSWRPENYSGKFYGPTRIREALIRSRNLVSIRLLRRVGIKYAADFLGNIGFERERIPENLSLALGSAELTPLEMASRYATLANGGFRVQPWLIERIEDNFGTELYRAEPATVCPECAPEVTLPASLVEEAGEPEVQPVAQDEVTVSALPGNDDQVVDAAPALTPNGLPVAPRVIDPVDHYLIYSILKEVITRGTGRRALALKRKDLA